MTALSLLAPRRVLALYPGRIINPN
jgi:hypothetical protein